MALSRLMAIDYGSVRIGIALSDPMQIIAKPFCVISNDTEAIPKIAQIVDDEKIEKIILGLPVNLAGEDTEKTREVRAFHEKMTAVINVPIEYWDERYSSSEAREILKEMQYTPREGRKIIDKIAASLILKDYMENN